MNRRLALSVSGPIKPIIRISRTFTATARRRSPGLIWRRLPKHRPLAAPAIAGPASWALTINLFLKQAIAIENERATRSLQEVRLSPTQLPSPIKFVWRAANLRMDHRTDLLRTVLRRLVLPEIVAIDSWRTLTPGASEAKPAARSQITSPLPLVMMPVGKKRRTDPTRPVLRSGRDRRFQTLTLPWHDRRQPLPTLPSPSMGRTGEPLLVRLPDFSPRRPTTIEARRNRIRPDKADRTVTLHRSARPWSTVTRSWRQGGVTAASTLVQAYRARSNAPVELVWPAPRAEGSAMTAYPGVATQAGASVTREIGSDLSSMNPDSGAVLPSAPDVERLVDEVFRRMDRQFRSERLRRGL